MEKGICTSVLEGKRGSRVNPVVKSLKGRVGSKKGCGGGREMGDREPCSS